MPAATPMTYEKKTPTIDAIQVPEDDATWEDIADWANGEVVTDPAPGIRFPSPRPGGFATAVPTDWITTQGGQFVAMTDTVFRAAYVVP